MRVRGKNTAISSGDLPQRAIGTLLLSPAAECKGIIPLKRTGYRPKATYAEEQIFKPSSSESYRPRRGEAHQTRFDVLLVNAVPLSRLGVPRPVDTVAA